MPHLGGGLIELLGMSKAEELETLEMRIAYQDAAINDLSDELYHQQKQIEALEEACRRLSAKLQAIVDTTDENGGEAAAPAETPPHY